MPDERMIHPAEGESEKLTKLTDLEFRVYCQYKLCADDFGVMTDSPSVLRGASRRLDMEKERVIQRAIDRMVALEVVHRFEHQGRRYLYSRNWQDWQHVKYPRATHLPIPPPDELDACTDDTRDLFSQRVLGRDGAGNVKEKEIEVRLWEIFGRALGETATIKTQVRLGNSYCDMVITPQHGPILAVEIKKHPLTPAALSQVVKYAEALQQQWPDRVVSPVVVGRGMGKLNEDALVRAKAAAITFDQHLNLTAIDRTSTGYVAGIPLRNNSGLTHARDRAGNANANANAEGVDRGESERGLSLSPGQLRAGVSSLVSLWNDRAVEPFIRVSDNLAPASVARVESALKAHPDLAWWLTRIVEVTTSTFCRGGGERGWVADFWWVLEHGDEIATGRYRDRASGSPRTKVQAISQANQGVLERALARQVQP